MINGWTTNIADGYTSLNHKIGTSEDITTEIISTSRKSLLTQLHEKLEELYDRSGSLPKSIITIPINDAFKEGRILKNDFFSKDENREEFNNYYVGVGDNQSLNKQIVECLIMASVYGGAYLIAVSNDQLLEEELIVKKGSISKITVMTPRQLQANSMSNNPLSKNYMKPDFYYSLIGGEFIHSSRVFYVDGETCTSTNRELNQGLGLSVYERTAGDLQNLSVSNNRGLNVLNQMSQDVFAMDGLNEMLKTDEGTSAVYKRLTYLNNFKSILSTLAIDGKDTYTNVSKSLGGIKEIIEVQMMLISSASRIPMTKLFGKSPDGQNSTGESDMKNYYDDIMSRILVDKVKPIYAWLDRIVMKHLFNSDEVVKYDFVPLYTLNEIEIADIEKKEADTIKVYIDAEIISTNEALKELQKKGKFLDIEVKDEY